MSATTPAQEMDIVERLRRIRPTKRQSLHDLICEGAAEIERLRDARADAIEECATKATEITATRGQRNAKDMWRAQIGEEVSDAIRALASRSALPPE